MKCYLLVLLLIGFARADNGIQTWDHTNFNCPDLNSQAEIDLDKIMGKWYVVEILEHKRNPMNPANGERIVIDSCPIINLRSHESSSLKLLWTEQTGNLEYNFRITDNRKLGFWVSSSQQNGTLAKKRYKQFSGCVHVMKAVASDMILTFCARQPLSELYSILLSREHTLGDSDRRGVHNLLRRRGLEIISIRETCMNGGAGWRRSAPNLVCWTTLFVLMFSSVLCRSWQQ